MFIMRESLFKSMCHEQKERNERMIVINFTFTSVIKFLFEYKNDKIIHVITHSSSLSTTPVSGDPTVLKKFFRFSLVFPSAISLNGLVLKYFETCTLLLQSLCF